MVHLKKIFNGEIIFRLKKRLKDLLCCYKGKTWYKLLSSLGLEGLIQIIVKFRTEKIFVRISIIHQTQTSFWGAQNIMHKILRSSTLVAVFVVPNIV